MTKVTYCQNNRRSGSPDFSKSPERKENYDKFKNQHIYDANPEYCKRSLGNGVPDFKRYVPRLPPGKKLITPDYYKPLEAIE